MRAVMKPFIPHPHALAAASALALAALCTSAAAQTSASSAPKKDKADPALPAVLVTDKQETIAGQVSVDTRAPAVAPRMTDGASLLKEIPNMGVVRKGQQAGDPVFRGLGGSRLAITANDQFLYGGCGIRMDTPTSYINPQAYDELVVTKGPQTVLKGPGLVAGAVEFVRHPRVYDKFGTEFDGALSLGSFGYVDAFGDFAAGNPLVSLRAIATRGRSDDYKDGDGNEVRSWYTRKSGSLNLAVTPTRHLRFELFADANRSKAKFASLQLDSGKTDRNSYGAKAEISDINPLLQKLSFETGYSHQDIIMGRQFRGLLAGGNPDRITRNAKASAELAWGANRTTAGLDWYADEHRARRAYTNLARSRSETSNNIGVFLENRMNLGEDRAWVAGLRRDRTRATTYPGFWYGPNAKQRKNRYNLTAAFTRFEFGPRPWHHYVGLGYTQRAPDFWERNRNRDIKPEKSLQLDVGTRYTEGNLRLNGSAFINRINDYILIYKDNPRLNDLAANSFARNISAMRYGFEASADYALPANFKVGGDLAWTWGRNQTDHRPLGQIPPLELRLRAGYETQQASLIGVMRAAARQNRVSVGDGNVNGVDIAPTPGFAVFGVHGHWRFNQHARLNFGIDNIFDRTYAEHLTKAVQTPEFYNGLGLNPNAGSTTRINEPGRSFWVRLDIKF